MKLKIILGLAILLPTIANAQWVNGVIQRDNTSTWIRYLQGANQVRLALYSDLPSGTDFIQNQSASAQTASSWISGSHIIGTNPSATGVIRLPNATNVSWRNNANNADIAIGFNSSNVFLVGGIGISTGSLTSSTLGSNTMVKTNGSNTLVPAVSNTDYLPVSSPAMTGTPTAPTATGGTNTTQIATTAFVQSALSGVGSGLMDLTTNQTVATGIKTFTPNISVMGMYIGTRVGTENTMLGVDAGLSLSSGNSLNTLIGHQSGNGITTGVGNTIVGRQSGGGISTAGNNTFIGRNIQGTALGSNNTVIGANVNVGTSTSGNIIIADGLGAVRAQHNGSNWVLGSEINGGTAANDDITIQGTTNATRTTSYVLLQPTAGYVGQGTTTPSISDFNASANVYHIMQNNTNGAAFKAESSNGAIYMAFGNNLGYLQVPTADPLQLGTNNTAAITISASQAIRFNTGYGAGTINSDGVGNLSSVSDARSKHNFTPYTNGLNAFRKLKGKATNYQWLPESGMDSVGTYTFFKAQDLRIAIPEAVWGDEAKERLSVDHRPIIAAATNAIIELDEKAQSQDEKINKLIKIIEKQDARILYLEKQLLK